MPLQDGDFETAGRFAEQLKDHRPNNFVPYSWLGVILTLDAKDRHTGSLDDFRTALQLAHDASLQCIRVESSLLSMSCLVEPTTDGTECNVQRDRFIQGAIAGGASRSTSEDCGEFKLFR